MTSALSADAEYDDTLAAPYKAVFGSPQISALLYTRPLCKEDPKGVVVI